MIRWLVILAVGITVNHARGDLIDNPRIGRWNRDVLDGWFYGKKNPARSLKAVRGEGTEGGGCLRIETSTGRSLAVATDRGYIYLRARKRIRMDVFAQSAHFSSGPLRIGLLLQSGQTDNDELPSQEVVFDEWQTLTFEYDKKKHRRSEWALINIVTTAKDEGVIFVDKVQIQ